MVADPAMQLARIAEMHTMTSGDCDECWLIWPCPTYVWATTDRDPLAPWDSCDDVES